MKKLKMCKPYKGLTSTAICDFPNIKRLHQNQFFISKAYSNTHRIRKQSWEIGWNQQSQGMHYKKQKAYAYHGNFSYFPMTSVC